MHRERCCQVCGAINQAGTTCCFACGRSLKATRPLPALTDAEVLYEALLRGRYRVQEQVGAGGFSTVYRARDVQVGHEVAIKQIDLQGLSAEEAIEATDTFNREANVLSSLQHPQIPQIYDQFSDQDHWYLVLQYLEGPTLEAYLETCTAQGKSLQLDEVLEMALQLGEVLHYLHTRQPPIIFRDLKPSNIIRTPPKGTLCLIDFGIARRFRHGQQRDTQALGSPGYAAPEQYGHAQTTPRSDIYSLGALLHFFLSGDNPAEASPGLKPVFLHTETGAEMLSELVQRMLSPDPELRPATMSEVIAALEAVRQQRIAQPTAQVWQPPEPRDLPSSWEGQQQVQIHVPSSHSPPAQTPASRRRGSSRRKVLIGLGGALAITAVGGAISGAFRSPYFLTNVVSELLTGQPPFQKLSDTAHAYLGHTDVVFAVAWSPNGKDIASASADGTVQIWNATSGHRALTYYCHGWSTAVAWSPNGRCIASGSNDNTVQVWGATTGKVVLTFNANMAFAGSTVTWSPDSKHIAAIDSTSDAVQVWEATTGKRLLTYREPMGAADAVAWSPNDRYIASGSGDDTVQVWEATTGKTLWYSPRISGVESVAWSPNGRYIASSSGDDTVQVWEATTGKTISTYAGHTNAVDAAVWSPNGRYIASGSIDKTVQVWEATTGKTILIYRGHTDSLYSVAWSPDGKRIASSSADYTVQVWDAP